ncbi:hypothetical protein EW146_g1145 [Bondarzewia mesenterica]|uniref:Uncharacterized protein n=1 Tax=Bondarzewia mesenterica TaxID=1095465 RepID=A0A4S4M4T9_9AGAM|nr:hypothetical protein EW146_g1145 [Bondarzewia mesenterica]
MTSLFPLPSPNFPDFKTLLIKGPYHPSAVFHLCLTHVVDRPGTKGIVLSPSRQKLLTALQEFNDDWLNECGGYGAVSQVLSKIDIFYPPSPLHLALLLSAFKVSETSDDPSLPSKITLSASPSLLVLHELSAYFLDGNSSTTHTLSSYLSLIAHASALSASLSAHTPESPVALVLMDSRLDELKLPVLKRPVFSADADDGEEHESVNRSHRKESVSALAQRYFEWVGTFEPATPTTVDSPPQSPQPSFTHRFRLCTPYTTDDEIVWQWNEREGELRGFSDRHGTLFTWA